MGQEGILVQGGLADSKKRLKGIWEPVDPQNAAPEGCVRRGGLQEGPF